MFNHTIKYQIECQNRIFQIFKTENNWKHAFFKTWIIIITQLDVLLLLLFCCLFSTFYEAHSSWKRLLFVCITKLQQKIDSLHHSLSSNQTVKKPKPSQLTAWLLNVYTCCRQIQLIVIRTNALKVVNLKKWKLKLWSWNWNWFENVFSNFHNVVLRHTCICYVLQACTIQIVTYRDKHEAYCNLKVCSLHVSTKLEAEALLNLC